MSASTGLTLFATMKESASSIFLDKLIVRMLMNSSSKSLFSAFFSGSLVLLLISIPVT
jgi:hypothetical protein